MATLNRRIDRLALRAEDAHIKLLARWLSRVEIVLTPAQRPVYAAFVQSALTTGAPSPSPLVVECMKAIHADSEARDQARSLSGVYPVFMEAVYVGFTPSA